jgi:hypothetical protein
MLRGTIIKRSMSRQEIFSPPPLDECITATDFELKTSNRAWTTLQWSTYDEVARR